MNLNDTKLTPRYQQFRKYRRVKKKLNIPKIVKRPTFPLVIEFSPTQKFAPLFFIHEPPDQIINWIPKNLLCCKLISTNFMMGKKIGKVISSKNEKTPNVN